MSTKATSNIVLLLLLTLFFSSIACTSSPTQIHIPSDAELEQKRTSVSKRELNYYGREMDDFRALSLRKIRKLVRLNSKKDEKAVDEMDKEIKHSYSHMLKRYAPDEEEKLLGQSVNKRLNCTKNDTAYMNFAKSGHVFGQHFKKDTNIIYIIREPDLNTLNTFSLSTGKALWGTGISHNQYTYSDLELSKVYFSNGTIEENVSSDWCGFFDTTCHIGRKMPIDSLLVSFTLNSIFEYDTLVLTANDVGKTYNNMAFHELENGFLIIEGNIDKIIEIECRNDKGMYLKKLLTYNDNTPHCSHEVYDRFIKQNKLLKEKLDAVDNKEDALRVIENSIIDAYTDPNLNQCKIYQFHKGNIKEVVVYYIVKRDNIVFDVMFRAANLKQQIFTNGFDDKTEILNRNGMPVLTLPVGGLNFATSRGYDEIDRGFENLSYLQSNEEKQYHFNLEEKKLTEMKSYSLRGALSSNLVKGWSCESDGYFILDNNMIATHDSAYDKVELNGTLIMAKRKVEDEGWILTKYHIYDGKGQKVLPYYVDNIAPHYNGIYRVTVNNKIGYMDFNGKWLIEPKYNVIDYDFDRRDEDMKYLLQIVSLNGKKGIIDLDNNLQQLIPCKYAQLKVIPNTNGQYYVASTSKKHHGIIDINGNIIRLIVEVNDYYYVFFEGVEKEFQEL